MRRSYLAVVAAAGLVVGTSWAARGANLTLNAVATYDANTATATNVVDVNANGNPLSATGPTDVAGFSANVATAFAANRGGVIDFEGAQTPSITPGTDTLAFTFAGGTKSFTVTPSRAMRLAVYGSTTAISGTAQFDLPDVTENAQSYTLTFGAITGGDAGEFISAIGFTANSRNSLAPTVTMTVGYSDGTSSSSLASALAAGAGVADTFYGFVAPAGKGITSLTVDRTLRVPFDDLGFVTSAPAATPEPGPIGLLGAGVVGVLGGRRRRGAKKS